LRILDSKDPRDRPAADSAPDIDEFLTDDARAFFDEVTAGLDAAGVAWTRNARLVRGLDYYRHTAFEFVTDRLGAQGTVLAGGRYDGLMEALGGPHTPAVGWAAGIERLGMMLERFDRPKLDAMVMPVNPEAERAATQCLTGLRRAGIAADMSYKGNLKKRMQKANASGAVIAVLVDADRWMRREVEVKMLESGEQRVVTDDDAGGVTFEDEIRALLLASEAGIDRSSLHLERGGFLGILSEHSPE
jgi:histidyl-tRNA synthetase